MLGKRDISFYPMLIVPIITLCVFVLYPFIEMFIYGFKGENGFTFDAYKSVFTNKSFFISFRHSIETGIATSVLSLLLSVPTALVMHYTKNKVIKQIVTLVILSALIAPPFVASVAYIELYGRRGLITYSLLHLRLSPYNAFGVILMQSITFAPFNVVFLLGALKNINSDEIASAYDLGADEKAILFDIIFKSIKRSIYSLLLLTFVRSIADYGTPIIIGGRYNTIASDIYVQLVGYSNLQKVSVMNLTLLFPSLIAFYFYTREEKRTAKVYSLTFTSSNGIDFRLSKAKMSGITCYILTFLYVLMIALQYFAIFLLSITRHTKNGYVFTIEHIQKFYTYNNMVFIRSILYALIVSFFSTFLALLLSYCIARRKNSAFKRIVECVVMLPYTIAGITFGIGYILAFNHEPLYIVGTATIVISNMIFKQFPVTYRIAHDAMLSIPESIDNAASDLGASKIRIFFSHIIPLMKNSFFSSFAYNFSSSMTTAGAILFLINPSKQLQVFKLFDAIYVGDYGLSAVMAEAIIIVVLLSEALFSLLCNVVFRKRQENVS